MAIQSALGQSGQPLSDKNKALAKGIVNAVAAATVTLSPGAVIGICPSGGPLANGAAAGGVLSGLNPNAMAQDIAASDGAPDKKVVDLATAICNHVQSGTVTFAVGLVTGACTNTPVNPGTFTGTASGGKVIGLSGDTLASMIAPDQGGNVSPQLKAMAGAITSHVMTYAEGFFALGTIIGVAPPAGGPLAGGAGTGGQLL